MIHIREDVTYHWSQSRCSQANLSASETSDLIRTVTDVIVAVAGEPLRQATWVVIDEVKSGNWGVGGQALGLDDVRAIQAETPGRS